MNLLCRLGIHLWSKTLMANVRQCRFCPKRLVLHDEAYPYRFEWRIER